MISLEPIFGGVEEWAAKITSDFPAKTAAALTIIASVLVLGPLLARTGEARVSLPGGCAIGPRPVDLHLKGLEELGAQIELREGYIHARAPQGLRGARIRLRAALGRRDREPADGGEPGRRRDRDRQCRARARGGRSRALPGRDGRADRGHRHRHAHDPGRAAPARRHHGVLPDRIELGTYAMAAAITGGELELRRRLDLIGDPDGRREARRGRRRRSRRAARGSRPGQRRGLRGVDVMTQPYPGFPTDLQAQFMALMCVAEGAAMITEAIFENRFMHVPELTRMGARITVHGGSALVRGVPRLTGAPVMATDLRASVSLILAGLAAEARPWSTASTTSIAATSG